MEKIFLGAGLFVELFYILVLFAAVFVYVNDGNEHHRGVFDSLKVLGEFCRDLGVVLILVGLALPILLK